MEITHLKLVPTTPKMRERLVQQEKDILHDRCGLQLIPTYNRSMFEIGHTSRREKAFMDEMEKSLPIIQRYLKRAIDAAIDRAARKVVK